VSLLIMHGSDVDARDMLKMTPLHWAVERGHTDVVDCLLSNGADINIQSKFEKTPIDIAYDNGRLEMVPTLQVFV
jgi:GA-binding protein transcription factor beta